MSTMTIQGPRTPERSLQQRRDALVRANAVRTARKEMKAWLRTLSPSVSMECTARLVRDPLVGVTDTMRVYDLLLSCRGIGPTRARDLLRRWHIAPSKTIGDLLPRQRQLLGVALDDLARHRRMTGRLR